MATKKIDPSTKPQRRSRKQQVVRLVVSCFIWLGAAILYYLAFSIFFDTPMEHELKHRADRMKQEYEVLEGRYDTLMMVLNNLSERDRAVFRSLFESDPYNFETDYTEERNEAYEAIFNRSNRRLKRDLRERTQHVIKWRVGCRSSGHTPWSDRGHCPTPRLLGGGGVSGY